MERLQKMMSDHAAGREHPAGSTSTTPHQSHMTCPGASNNRLPTRTRIERVGRLVEHTPKHMQMMLSSNVDGGFWKPASTAEVSNENGGYRGDARNEDDVATAALMASATVVPQQQQSRRSSGAALAQQRLLLPIYKHKRQILYAVEHYGVTVICGETGSGKSTQIPQYLVTAGGWAGNDFQVVCTQPRRIAAVSLAQRVAQEAGTTVGDRVGYAVRFDDQSSRATTQIKYVTDGLLLREATMGDPLLSKYSVVMVDEAHEKTVNTDALLGLLKKIRRKRKGLRLIVCSATIDAQQFLDFFIGSSQKDGPSAVAAEGSALDTAIHDRGTIISVDGRQHPVDILYRERAVPDYIHGMVETAWQIHRQHPLETTTSSDGGGGGGILCFLPSGEDIDHAIRLAEEQFREEQVEFLPLYGTLPLHMQARVFQKTTHQSAKTSKKRSRVSSSSSSSLLQSSRRIIFATNIAETSVTVPDISFVIDSGLVKLPYFDPRTGLERLIVGPTSRASARQRAGRAGRIGPGKCYRLYTEQYLWQHMAAHTPAEMVRTNLASLILTLKALGVENILAFDLMDIPAVESLAYGLELLYALGAIEEQTTSLTPLGLDMSAFPTEPGVARMLLESLHTGCAWEVLGVAAALQVRSLFYKPRGPRGSSRLQQQQLDYDAAMRAVVDPSGDHVTYTNLLAQAEDHGIVDEDEWRNERFVNVVALKRALEVRSQLGRFLRRFGRLRSIGISADEEMRSKAIRRCVVAGFFFNVAKLANDGRYYTLRKQILVVPAQSSVYASHATISSEYIVFGETVDGPRGGIELKSVSAIEARWLREVAPHYWE